MGFTTSWTYKAVDAYTPVGKKIVAVNLKIKKSLVKAAQGADKLNAKLEKTERRFKGLNRVADRFKKFGVKMTAFATLPITLMGKAFFTAASDAVESESKFNEVFKGISGKANMMSTEFAKSFDLADSTARELLGTTGDILSGFGFTEEKALELSLSINELAGDITSFKNVQGGVPRTSSAITKALLGEREALKGLGIAILEEDVKKKMLTQKTEGLTFASARQAKAFATLTLVQERGANSIGDYARTQHLAANVTRAFSERFKNMNEQFGKVFLPLATKVIIRLTKFVDVLSDLSPGTKKAILIVGGLIAVLGPLALVIGGLIAIAPAMAAGFAIMFGPIGIAVTAAVALLALLSKIRGQQTAREGTIGKSRRARRQRLKEMPTAIPSGAAALSPAMAEQMSTFTGRERSRGGGRSAFEGAIDINVRTTGDASADTDTSGFENTRVRLSRGRNLAGQT